MSPDTNLPSEAIGTSRVNCVSQRNIEGLRNRCRSGSWKLGLPGDFWAFLCVLRLYDLRIPPNTVLQITDEISMFK